MASIPDLPIVDGDTISDEDLKTAIDSCGDDNPCEASWQAAYVNYADKMYDLATFQALVGVVLGTIQYASADRTADQQYDIADRQLQIAEEEYQRYKDVYVECEDALAEEVCAIECPDVDYNIRAERAEVDVAVKFNQAKRTIIRLRNRHCAVDNIKALTEITREEAKARVMARDMAYRAAEARQDFLDERRWTKRMAILQHGRNIMTGQSNVYQSAMGAATQALTAEQQALNSFLGTIGGGIGAVANAATYRSLANYQPPQYSTGNSGTTFASTSVSSPNVFQSGVQSGVPSGLGAVY